jgi:SAM-dependent methyltransferase
MSNVVAPGNSEEWFATPLGRYLLAREQAYFDHAITDIFGYNAFQLGMVEHDLLRASRIPFLCRVAAGGAAQLRADFHELPIAGNSADLMILPHALEFSEHPHQILREVARVLRPEAQVVIAGFNPWSLWGLRRAFHAGGQFPWHGRFINLARLKDWLALLGFEISAGQMSCYVPPCAQENWLQRCGFMEAAGDRWWPMAGGVYFLQAIKRVPGMRLIVPKWSERLAPKKNLAAAPEKVGKADEPVAACTRFRD